MFRKLKSVVVFLKIIYLFIYYLFASLFFIQTFSRFTAEEENEEFHSTTPFPIGSVVRLYPLTFSGRVPCVRLELYGLKGMKLCNAIYKVNNAELQSMILYAYRRVRGKL